jgi:protein required for attachment to host cells
MSEYCVVVADASRARLFTLVAARSPRIESGPNLVEAMGLVNPEMEIPDRELFSESRGGANRAMGAGVHGYDDHRGKHEQENERRSAQTVAKETKKLVKQSEASQLVLCASARMLGFLRKSLKQNGTPTIHDVPRDMTKMSPQAIHSHLAKIELLPACDRKSRTWRSCAQKTRPVKKG